jgi:hypothetical protein
VGFRFQKRIRIFKGLTLNLSKSGTSWTVGGKGASVNVRGDKVSANAGIPGTGISYRQRLGHPLANQSTGKSGSGAGRVVWAIFFLAVLGFFILRR